MPDNPPFKQEGVPYQCPKCGTHLLSKDGTFTGRCPICADRAHEIQAQRPNPWRRSRADIQWELAGLARQEGDYEAERIHTERARAIERGEE